MQIVTARCGGCGTDVQRAVGMPGQPSNWRVNVLCPNCRDESPERDWATLLAVKARRRFLERVRGFDAAAGYETADLTAPDVANTRWSREARGAVETCGHGGTARAGLMFVGPTGIGKTYAAFAVCNEAARMLGADGVRFTTEEDLIGGDVPSWERKQHLNRFLQGAHTVLVDDIGVASRRGDQVQAGWKELCGLIAAQPGPVLLVGTTNRQGWDGDQGLAAWVGAQSASRLRQWTVEVTTGWTDRRTGVVHERWRSSVAGNR